MQQAPAGRILLIEDEAPERKLFRRKFAETSFQIIEASNGKEGLQKYRQHLPDLIVTDIIMPESEGMETIMNLKKENPDIKIIAVSGGDGSAKSQFLKMAKHLGAKHAFSKPIDWPELIKTVKEMLN